MGVNGGVREKMYVLNQEIHVEETLAMKHVTKEVFCRS